MVSSSPNTPATLSRQIRKYFKIEFWVGLVRLACMLVGAAVLLAGCTHRRATSHGAGAVLAPNQSIGTVVHVDLVDRFVVIQLDEPIELRLGQILIVRDPELLPTALIAVCDEAEGLFCGCNIRFGNPRPGDALIFPDERHREILERSQPTTSNGQ